MNKAYFSKKNCVWFICALVLILEGSSSATTWTYNAQTQLCHACGRADGAGWSVNVAQDNAGHMCFGPYTTAVSGGLNTATFNMMIDNNAGNDRVLTIDVYDATASTVLATREIYRNEFSTAYTYQNFNLSFTSVAGHTLEFRTWWYDTCYMNEQCVNVSTTTSWTFQAQTQLCHAAGRADGLGWSVSVGQDPAGCFLFGPYTTVVGGLNTAYFRLKIDNNAGNDRVLIVDVYDQTTSTSLANRFIYRNEFLANNTYQNFDLSFTSVAGHNLEFRTNWSGNCYMNEQYVQVIPKIPSTSTSVIYHVDMRSYNSGIPTNETFDAYQTAACLQGLANRDAPRVFISCMDYDPAWLDRLTEPGGMCEGWQVQTLTFQQLVTLFRKYINGVVLYDPDPNTGAISSSLVATTVAGVEGGIPLRKDSTSSTYQYLINTLHLPVLLDLSGKFTGSGTIWQTSTPSTGSAKCDAYIWAKQKYIDTGRCDPTLLMYTLDEYALKTNLNSRLDMQLVNLDYSVSRKGFCFELDPWDDEIPNDDPYQPLGTDYATFRSILDSCNTRTGKNCMIKLCGFPNWQYKYSNYCDPNSTNGPIDTEGAFTRLCSWYNVYIDADAPSPGFIANASFYAKLLPEFKERRYVQNPAPTYTDMRSRGLIDSSGNVVPGNYMMIHMGDYDASAWTLYNLADARFDDTARGQIALNWAINPNLIDRVCPAMDYFYRNKTSKDYFHTQQGAGDVTVHELYGTRGDSGYPSGVAIWQKHCREYYRPMDYSITGFVTSLWFSTLDTTDCSINAPFSNDGIGIFNQAFITPALLGNIPVDILNWEYINIPTGVHFAWYRDTDHTPTQLKAIQDGCVGTGHYNQRFLDDYTFYYLMRYYLGGNNNYKATWTGDTIPRIMQSGQTYAATVTVRNDGWDTWSESSLYRLGHAIVSSGVTPVYSDYDTRGRSYIPSGTVAPGQSVTFTLNVTAPSTAGRYDLYYDMVRDGLLWFSGQNIEWKKEIIVAGDISTIDTDGDGVPDVTEQANGTMWWNADSY